MIPSEERKIIKELIGWNYASKISEYLESKGFRNRNGHPFSLTHIRNVLNGSSHEQLEKHIFDFAIIKKKAKKKEEIRRRSLLTPKSA